MKRTLVPHASAIAVAAATEASLAGRAVVSAIAPMMRDDELP